MTSLRVFFVGGYLAYRALFTWLRPSIYVPTMLGGPIFQILFFAYVGRFSGLQNDEFFVIGNAVQASALAGIFGMAMTIGGERWYQTLSALLATPAHRIPLFLGRAIPLIVNGFIVSAFGFAVGWALLDFELAADEIPGIALVVVVTSFSCTALGLLTGSIGLRARDVFFLANLVALLLLLFCGVNVPLDAMPDWMQTVASGLPLTHGIEAAREIAAGAPFSDVSDLVATEVAIGVVYALVAYGLFRFFEVEARRKATLETM
jgi:ABC-2 type transport system permease protein